MGKPINLLASVTSPVRQSRSINSCHRLVCTRSTQGTTAIAYVYATAKGTENLPLRLPLLLSYEDIELPVVLGPVSAAPPKMADDGGGK